MPSIRLFAFLNNVPKYQVIVGEARQARRGQKCSVSSNICSLSSANLRHNSVHQIAFSDLPNCSVILSSEDL